MVMLVVLAVLLGSLLSEGHSDQAVECTSPQGRNGICRLIRDCPSIMKLLPPAPIKSPEILKFLNESRCSAPNNKGSVPLICCPIERIPKLPYCGFGETFRLIGGQKVFLGEFPWTAVIDFRHRADGSIRPQCGGALVSSRYVLTAAHCVHPSSDDDWKAVSVRLGEHDLSTSPDCDEFDDCSHSPITAGIEKIVIHEGYNPFSAGHYDDIALIRLDRDIEFNAYVRPVCLPLEVSERTRNITGAWNARIIGWGLTKSAHAANEKLRVELEILDKTQCSELDGMLLRDTQFCTKNRYGYGICSADSGGSLILREPKRHESNILYGIASFGKNDLCGTNEETAVYTDVSKYADWIDNNIVF